MTLVAIDGFDLYNGVVTNTGLQAKWVATQTANLSMQAGHFGGQCVKLATPIGTGLAITRSFTAARASSAVGLAIFWSAFPTNPASILGNYIFMNTATFQCGVRVNADGSVSAYRLSSDTAGTLLGASAAGVIHPSTWHYLEIECTLSTTVGVLNVYVDDVLVLALTGVNNANAGVGTTANAFRVSNFVGTPNEVFEIDDYYEADAATRIGPLRVTVKEPSSDSAVTWTPNSGANNYSRVNEAQTDGDTSYVQCGTVGDRDLYGFTPLGVSPATIYGVQISSFAEKTDVAARSINNSAKSGTTDSDGTTLALASAYGKLERAMMLTDPDTGSAFTVAGLDAMLAGPKVGA